MFKIKHLRWYMVALLLMATTINYLDRQALSVSKDTVCKKFNMDDVDYSRITAAFLFFYAIMQPFAGRIIDLLKTRLGFALAVSLWSVTNMCHAFARGVLSFSIFRSFLGVFEAGNFPGCIRTVAEWFPAKERTAATGFFNAGAGIGSLIAPYTLAFLIIKFGWQSAFVATGAVGFVWVGLWLWLYREPEKHPRITAEELDYIHKGQQIEGPPDFDKGSGRDFFQLVRRREVWGIFVARGLTDAVWFFYVFWLPAYFQTVRGYSLKQVGYFTWVPFLSADVASVLGGLLPVLFMRYGMRLLNARKLAMLLSALVMPASVMAFNAPTAAVAIAWYCIATAGHNVWAASILTLPADLFPKRLMGLAYGLCACGGGLISAGFQLAFGHMIKGTGYGSVLTVVGFLHLTAWVVVMLTVRSRPKTLLSEA